MEDQETAMDEFWQFALTKARTGSMEHPPVGEPGSAGCNIGDVIPKTLILCDGCLLSSEVLSEGFHLCPFPSVSFQHVVELDLSGNSLLSIPDNISEALPNLQSFFLGGYPEDHPEYKNRFTTLPDLSDLVHLYHLSVHDTELKVLPTLPDSLAILRLDRCPMRCTMMPPKLPPYLTILHLEGCSLLPGDLDHPHLLPKSIQELEYLQDLQLPDGSHVGEFFGTPLPELLGK
ncbi:MAG: hypothetical protein SGBAC_006292 [Bacillariaceae sp.]